MPSHSDAVDKHWRNELFCAMVKLFKSNRD